MEKNTTIENTLLNEIKLRKSGRAYAEKPVEKEKLTAILEAARWAPSSMNEQPWRYILADSTTNKELYDRVFDALNDSNKIWVQKAPVLLVSLAKKTLIRNGVVNRHAMYDTGAANILLSIQATAMGLNIHQLGGFNYEKLKASLQVPDDLEIAAVLSVGYPGSADELPEALRARELAPRERYTLSELVMEKGF